MYDLPKAGTQSYPELSATKSTIGIAGLLVIAAVLLIPAAGTVVYEMRANNRAQARLTAASQEYDAAAAQMRILERKVQSVEQTRAELLAESNEAAAAVASHAGGGRGYSQAGGGSSGSGGADGKNKAPVDPLVAGQQFLNQFPQARAMMLQNNNPAVLMAYAPFMRQANLTPAQAQQFTALMANSWVDNLAVTPQGMVLGPNSTPTFDQISQVIGDQAAQQFENYTQTMTYPYTFTDQVATAASLAGAPLTDQQNDQLAQIIASNAAPYTIVPGTIGPGNWNAAATAVNWDAAIAQAKASLPPAQFEAVQGGLLQLQFEAAAAAAQQAKTTASSNP